jgi:hypothetical protein
MSNLFPDDDSWLDNYNLQIEKEERNRIIAFINSIIMDLEKFNDPAEDLKSIVTILESEDWALGY